MDDISEAIRMRNSSQTRFKKDLGPVTFSDTQKYSDSASEHQRVVTALRLAASSFAITGCLWSDRPVIAHRETVQLIKSAKEHREFHHRLAQKAQRPVVLIFRRKTRWDEDRGKELNLGILSMGL